MIRAAQAGGWFVVAVFVGGLFASAGCGGPEPPAKHPVVSVAPFDLDCPEKELSYTQIDENTMGVTGCGKRAKYVQICDPPSSDIVGALSRGCRWLRN